MDFFYLFCHGAEDRAEETGLPILRELSHSVFLKASVSNAPGLSIKLFDKIIVYIKSLSNVSAFCQ